MGVPPGTGIGAAGLPGSAAAVGARHVKHINTAAAQRDFFIRS
ncbi:hypothetical protein MMCCUG48898_1151 [Mycobacteroides abscessus subsp. massiliense CCUG 48898 = JCM 15300]|nr:hypothetical protein MMAS_12580 [Mycobacteroides abscessus subsp. massiliense CCUG 48898 = JCM 15300]EIV67819.1 hypothetical protein MMCCUG48898_1151 [Mycobacteroides abscessus subsp. massiliense CCUG 48898 = JCM 15300]BAP96125.1 hypothetical protein MMASJCM_1349 [Mycobacteroides abscessus subsp. massiliense CCUG 48898 = JCM 15300]